MIKIFCDKCGKEITNANPLTVTLEKISPCWGGSRKEEWQLCVQCEMELTSNYLNPNIREG